MNRTRYPLRPFLASYGGGHHRITGALTRAFLARGDSPVLMGFTTAYQSLLRDGLPARPVTDLIDTDSDTIWLERADAFTQGSVHPDISPEETRAYFAIGLRSLAEARGLDQAIAIIREKGRFAFEPVATMRRYLKTLKPDIVITTTSPRFEAATLKAARLEGVPTLAVGDLFLSNSLNLILSPDFAEDLAVINEDTKDTVAAAGFPADRIHVTGNPAFDSLALKSGKADTRDALRSRLGIGSRKLILWPGNAANSLPDGRPLIPSEAAVASLEAVCARDPSWTYIFRRHPNAQHDMPAGIRTGFFDDGTIKIEDALQAADLVCAEVSTVALQAALVGKPVITVGLHDYTDIAHLGLAYPIGSLEDLGGALASSGFVPRPLRMPALGTATDNVLDLVDRIVSRIGKV